MGHREREPNTIDVAVSMNPKLLERLKAHLEALGEKNRSGWIRGAIITKMGREREELRDPEEVIY